MRVWNTIYVDFLPLKAEQRKSKGVRTRHYLVEWEKADLILKLWESAHPASP
jgi:hypothetical protein